MSWKYLLFFYHIKLIIYQNGDIYEIGKIKQLTPTGAFVWYSEGETAAKTPYEAMHKIINAHIINYTRLGGDSGEVWRMDSSITMDAIVTFLGQMGASSPPEMAELCKAAVSIIFPILEERSRTPEEDLDILHDYRLQARQYRAMYKRHVDAGRTVYRYGVWHCPACNRRVHPHHGKNHEP